ncbi:CRISPR-associated endonuclease Cas2 [Spirochaeta thermophila]
MVVVSYDVGQDEGGQKRLRKMAKLCEGFGQRVQYSVFECLVDPAQWVNLKAHISSIINPEYDSVRFYFLGANWKRRVESLGKQRSFEPDEPMII